MTFTIDPQLMRNACRVHGIPVLAGDSAIVMMRKLLYMEPTTSTSPLVALSESKWRADQRKKMAERGLQASEAELDRRWAVIVERKLAPTDMKLDRTVYDDMSASEKTTLTIVLETKEGALYVRPTEAAPVPPTAKPDGAVTATETTTPPSANEPSLALASDVASAVAPMAVEDSANETDRDGDQSAPAKVALSPEEQREVVAAAAERRALSLSADITDEAKAVPPVAEPTPADEKPPPIESPLDEGKDLLPVVTLAEDAVA